MTKVNEPQERIIDRIRQADENMEMYKAASAEISGACEVAKMSGTTKPRTNLENS